MCVFFVVVVKGSLRRSNDMNVESTDIVKIFLGPLIKQIRDYGTISGLWDEEHAQGPSGSILSFYR